MSLAFPSVFPVLVTPRLVLRRIEERDREAIFRMFGNPEAMRFWSAPAWTRPELAAAWIERVHAAFEAREAIRWAIVRRESDNFVGTCTFFNIDPQNRRAEVGYILDRAAWGQGVMREALTAMLAYGFRAVGLHRIEADIDPRNAASVRALEHFGFAREGLFRERWRVGDEITDSLMMGLLAREWLSHA